MKYYQFLFITICIFSSLVSSKVLKRRHRRGEIDQSKYAEQIKSLKLLDKIYDPDFKIFNFVEENWPKSRTSPDNVILPVVLLKVLEKENLLQYFDMKDLDAFLEKIAKDYKTIHPVYYHNAIHAADVVQTLYSYIHTSGIAKIMDDYEKIALYFAGACHDLKHPGLNNGYYQKKENGVKTIFDFDVSKDEQHILEKMHAAIALKYLDEGVLSKLESEKQKIKELVKKFIEETDNSKHFPHLGDLSANGKIINEAIKTGKIENIEEAKIKVLSALVHAADISNPTKIFSEYKKHAIACVEEFINQYLTEEKQKLALTEMFNPNTGNGLANRQIGFIRFIRSYVDTIVNQFRGIENGMHIQSNMDHNLAKFLAILDKEENAEPDISDLDLVERINKVKLYKKKSLNIQ